MIMNFFKFLIPIFALVADFEVEALKTEGHFFCFSHIFRHRKDKIIDISLPTLICPSPNSTFPLLL